MGKLKWHIILVLALLLVFCGMAGATQFYVNESGWWRDGGAFNVSDTPIHAAVDNADAGETIYVYNGSYNENVNMNKRLTLKGEGRDVVTVTAKSSNDHVFEVTADYVSISGFTVTGGSSSYKPGIHLNNAHHCNIYDNSASNSLYGISLSSSSNYNTLTNNTASNNAGGIDLTSSNNNNTLTANTANSNNWDGIDLTSSNNNITCNWVQNNTKKGVFISGSTGNNISYNNIIKNGAPQGDGSYHWQFYIDQYQPVEAKHNYWGAGMNSSTIDASIYDDEEGGWGEVHFYPFETEPVQCPLTPETPAFTTTDAMIALQIAVGSRPPDPRWDVSGDGSVTSLDALMILQAAVGSTEID